MSRAGEAEDRARELIEKLKAHADPGSLQGMARFGIRVDNSLGVRIPAVRKLAKSAGKDHDTAARLWASGIQEARMLAALIDEPEMVTERQMERWAACFDSWDLCDQVCANLFDKLDIAPAKAEEWAGREEEFVKRAGFVLMAVRAVHAKKSPDREFVKYLSLVEREACDERNFVKKAVNWALRQIGKRNAALMKKAVKSARKIEKMESRAARWIARDALREFERKGGLQEIS